MDAPDDAIDFLELSVAATLRSRRVPVVGEFCIVRSAPALATAPSTAASTSSTTSPPPAVTALATCGAVPGVVPVESAVVAGTWAGPATLTLRARGEAVHLAAVLEQVVAVGVDVAPWIFIALRSQGRLYLLGERLGDEDALVGTGVPLLALGGGGLVLGFLLPGDSDPLFCAGAAVRELP